jgi:hypothetical protein
MPSIASSTICSTSHASRAGKIRLTVQPVDLRLVIDQADLGGDVAQDDLQRAPRLLGIEVASLEDGGPAVHRIERGA